MRSGMTLESVEQLRALAHPVRQRILRLLAHQCLTNKQLASLLDESPARLHFHVRELEEAGLIELVEERPKGGVVEKYYRATAQHFQLGPSLGAAFSNGEGLPIAAVDAARREIERATAHYKMLPRPTHIFHEQAKLSTDALEEVQRHLNAIQAIMSSGSGRSDAVGQPVVFTYVLHPLPPDHPDHVA